VTFILRAPELVLINATSVSLAAMYPTRPKGGTSDAFDDRLATAVAATAPTTPPTAPADGSRRHRLPKPSRVNHRTS
jgi:hypothetical protein